MKAYSLSLHYDGPADFAGWSIYDGPNKGQSSAHLLLSGADLSVRVAGPLTDGFCAYLRELSTSAVNLADAIQERKAKVA